MLLNKILVTTTATLQSKKTDSSASDWQKFTENTTKTMTDLSIATRQGNFSTLSSRSKGRLSASKTWTISSKQLMPTMTIRFRRKNFMTSTRSWRRETAVFDRIIRSFHHSNLRIKSYWGYGAIFLLNPKLHYLK